MRCVIYLQWVSALHQASRVRHKQVARAHCSSCLWCAISCACDTRSRVASGLPVVVPAGHNCFFQRAMLSCALTISPKHISSRPALSSGMSPATVQVPPARDSHHRGCTSGKCGHTGTRTRQVIAARTCPLWSVGRSGRPETRVRVGSAHRIRQRKKATLQQNTCKRIGESGAEKSNTAQCCGLPVCGYWGQVRVDPSTWYLPPKSRSARAHSRTTKLGP